MAPHNGDRIVIGVDIGTTFTGVCFAYSKSPNDLEVITAWPGANSSTSEKVPTEFTYDLKKRQSTGSSRSSAIQQESTSNFVIDALEDHFRSKQLKDVRWGFQLRPGEPRFKCLKLFLDRNQALPNFISGDSILNDLKLAGRNVIDGLADFLAKVNAHTMNTLCQRYGEAFVKSTPVEVVLTVPAIWSDAAQDATKQASLRAGMGPRIRVISEPEAAAVYALKATQPNELAIGDNIVVCDAGGGTVDLISYRISNLEPLSIQESQVGSGGLCGSVFLNYRFQEHVKERLGESDLNQYVRSRPYAWNEALEHFDTYVKRNFQEEDEDDPDGFSVRFIGHEDNEAAGVSLDYMTMNSDQLKEIFEPVVQDVIRLIEDQVSAIHARDELVSSIVLVGGFGQSPYLFTRVKKHFVTNHPPAYSTDPKSASTIQRVDKHISVLRPINAWTATARGAVLRGLEGDIVTSRRSRYHYGKTYRIEFDGRIHNLSQRCWCPLDELYIARHNMKWMLAKGEQISEERRITFPFTKSIACDDDLLGRSNIYGYNRASAPSVYNKPTCFKVCEVEYDLNTVERRLFRKCTNSKGKTYRKLRFELEMKMDSASLEFSIMVDGKCQGKATANFEHEGS
ncbi:MAG: hypothetical protein M1831_006193 [Alyxoria varia]|nr:MAG: hypothetical protein M1831_006193 [Alyxoria varia]